MGNIYDIAGHSILGDQVGAYQQGVNFKQKNQVFGQKQAAYQDALSRQQQVQNLAPQIIAGDPQATEQAQAADPTAAAQYQDAATQHIKRLQGAISYIDSQKDPQAKEAAYQQVRPYLSQFGQEPPATFAEAEPKMEAARAQIAALLAQQKPGYINVAAGGALVDPMTGKPVFQNQGIQKAPAIVSVNLPDGSTQQYQQNPDGSLAPLRLAGQGGAAAPQAPQGPQAAPQPNVQLTPNPNAQSIAADQATALVSNGADPGQAAAQAMAMHPGTTLAFDQASGRFRDVSDGSEKMGASQLGHSAPKPQGGIPSGYRARADGQGLEPIPGGPADKGQAASPLGDPTQTGQSYLQSIADPAMESMIKAVAEGRMPLPKIYRSGKAGEIGPTQIAQAVAQYDPTYDQADPTSRIKARNDFTSGKSAVQLRQLNTLLGHLGGLADATEKLDNTGYTPLNAVENYLGSQVNTKVSNFQAAARPAAEEFAAILKGGVPSVEEIKAAHELLDPNKTPDQLRGVIGTMAAQIQSRIAALHAQAQNSLGPFANKVTILTPEGERALDNLRKKGFIGKFDAGESGGTPDQSAKPATPQYRAVNSMGHAVVWNGSAWVPE